MNGWDAYPLYSGFGPGLGDDIPPEILAALMARAPIPGGDRGPRGPNPNPPPITGPPRPFPDRLPIGDPRIPFPRIRPLEPGEPRPRDPRVPIPQDPGPPGPRIPNPNPPPITEGPRPGPPRVPIGDLPPGPYNPFPGPGGPGPSGPGFPDLGPGAEGWWTDFSPGVLPIGDTTWTRPDPRALDAPGQRPIPGDPGRRSFPSPAPPSMPVPPLPGPGGPGGPPPSWIMEMLDRALNPRPSSFRPRPGFDTAEVGGAGGYGMGPVAGPPPPYPGSQYEGDWEGPYGSWNFGERGGQGRSHVPPPTNWSELEPYIL